MSFRPLAALLVLALVAGCSSHSKRVLPPVPPGADGAFGAFVATAGPPGDSVYAIATRALPLVMLAATSRGIQRTSVTAAHWTHVDDHVARALISVNDTLSFAGASDGVLRSLDGGLTWQSFDDGLTAGANVLALAWVGGIGLFAGFSGGGISLFADGADHWNDASSGLPAGATVSAIAYVSSSSQIFAVADGRIYASATGTSWAVASTGLPGNAVTALLDAFPMAGTDGAGAYVSTDDGAHWQNGSTGMTAGSRVDWIAETGFGEFAATDHGVFSNALSPPNWVHWDVTVLPSATEFTVTRGVNVSIFAGTAGRGIVRTDDRGFSWSTYGPPDAKVTAIVDGGFGTLAAVEGAGVYRSLSGGVSWQITSLETGTFTGFAVRAGKIFASSASGIELSVDDGVHWSSASGPSLPANPNVPAIAADGSVVLASVQGSPAGVYRSIDDGATWLSSSGLPATPAVVALAASGARMLAGLNSPGAAASVFTSTDHGAIWHPTGGGLPAGVSVRALAGDGSVALAATSAGVFRSLDNGTSWTSTNIGAGHDATSIALHGASDTAVIDGSVWRSIDDGVTWTKDPDVASPGVVVTAGASAFFAGTFAGMWRAPY